MARIKEIFNKLAERFWLWLKRAWSRFVFVFPFLLLTLGVVGTVISAVYINRTRLEQYEQTAASRWGQDSNYDYRQVTAIARAQMTQEDAVPLYADESMSFNVDTIENIRQNLDAMISTTDTRHVIQSDRGPAVEQWADAYSSSFRATLSPIIGGDVLDDRFEASVVGVAGQYTLFHPMEHFSGSFLTPESIQPDSIVLNDQLAWNMFRSYDVVDQAVEINGREYMIVGVVREGRHSAHVEAGASRPRAYVHFEELKYLQSSEIGEQPSDYYINDSLDYYDLDNVTNQTSLEEIAVMYYEVVLPDPIRNIAYNDLKNAIDSYSESTQNFLIINNTDRFRLSRLLRDYFPIGEQRIERNAFECPYWEISAQIAEDQIRLGWTIMGASIIVISISALCACYNLKKHKGIRRV